MASSLTEEGSTVSDGFAHYFELIRSGDEVVIAITLVTGILVITFIAAWLIRKKSP